MQTPEFLIWSLERRCQLRQIDGFEDPERTERHLRTLRAYSEAAAEGRVFEGICAAPPNGFRVEDGLSLYGGLAAARKECFDCPANLPLASNLAGCFGVLPLPRDENVIHAAVEQAIKHLDCQRQINFLLSATRPAWYGLWMHSPLESRRAMLVKDILVVSQWSLTSEGSLASEDFSPLLMALESAHGDNLPLHVRLYPRGEVQGTWWNLAPHCQACHAPWPESQRERCLTCGYVGHPASPPKRRARGTRPYWPLERMLGKEQAAVFLMRYEARSSP